MKPLLFTLFIFMFFQAHAVEVLPNGRFPKNLSESARFGVARSKSSTYHSVFDRHESIDKNRHIGDFTLYRDGEVLYTLTDITASDMRVSNAGYTLVFEKGGESTLRFYSPAGKMVREVSGENYILGEFSERGNLFALATPEQTSIISLKSRTVTTFPPAQNIAFSPDESHFAIGCSSGVKIFTTAGDLRTAISHDEFYIRRLAFSPDARYLSFIGKKKLYTYDRESEKTAFTDSLSDNRNFNDILFENGSLVAGTYARNRQENHVEGSTVSYSMDGHKTAGTATALREYAPALTHNEHGYGEINEQGYESVPWPHYPFDEPDTVWNGYLALSSSGDGNNSAAYLHQGTDLNVANHEAAHSVSDGYVKAYLSTGGELYWRVAVAPENTSATQNGWLYAHLVERSVAVNVGDYVQQGDYIGDVIPWPNLVGGHLHFSRLEHSGQVWDGNWRNKENPVFSLRPHGDNIPPEIRSVYNDSKFGFTTNTSSPQRLSADNLQGDIDILTRVSDKAGISEWRQPASTINYWFTDARTGDTVVPKELALWRGQDMPDYSGSLYYSLVPVMYRVTREFPVNGWFTEDRLFIHVITNNDADSSLTPDHSQYGFNTAEYPDGEYNLVVEVFDEAGNSTVDSQTVTFNNGNSQTYTLSVESSEGGSVSLSPDGNVFDEGTEVELTAQAEEGYEFQNWDGDLSGSQNPESLVMDEDKTISAYFEFTGEILALTTTMTDTILTTESTHGISWTGKNISGAVSLALLTPGNEIKLLDDGLEGSGTYEWTIAADHATSPGYRLIATSQDAADTSDSFCLIQKERAEDRILISQQMLSIESVSSEETNGETAPATHLLDMNHATRWHTEWSDNTAEHPHSIVFKIDVPEDTSIGFSGLAYTPRLDDKNNSLIADYTIETSLNNADWETVHEGSWDWSGERNIKTVDFDPLGARYIRFTTHSTNPESQEPHWASGVQMNFFADPAYDGSVHAVQKGGASAPIVLNGSILHINTSENLQIHVTSIAGRTVRNIRSTGRGKINFSTLNLSPGIYLLSLQNERGGVLKPQRLIIH